MPTTSARIAERHRALSNPTRVHILRILGETTRDDSGFDAATIAERLDLHVSTVRTHLGILENSAMVTSQVEARRVRGRPRRLYRATEPPPSQDGQDGAYLALADALGRTLADPDVDEVSVAADTGVLLGRRFMEQAPSDGPSSVRDRLYGLLEEFGFDPSKGRKGTIDLRRCPIVEAARGNPAVVCGLHHGVLVGAAQALGYAGEVRLEPFATTTTCRVALAE